MDNTHTHETISYLVAEAGNWVCPEDGHHYVAGNTLVKDLWVDVEFGEEMANPVVFSQITTDNQ